MTHYIGIDVGTGSARAGVFDARGALLGTAQHAIESWRPAAGRVQQSSANIWAAVAQSIRDALTASGIDAATVRGIGFDATCSMVVSGADGAPVSIDADGAADQDVIVWMDHRAMGDAAEINAIGGAPLKHVGGTISPEMQMPKLRWLKRELPQAWQAAEAFWDLPDWLVHRATGAQARSLCSTVCKWTYMAHLGDQGEGWDDDFLRAIGLDDLTGAGHARIGTEFLTPGARAGGLTAEVAAELGLPEGTPVAASLIDAHAGALGTLGSGGAGAAGRLAVIAGTSTCHIALTDEPAFVPGVWGPYFGAVTPGTWCNEGGQSAAGALIDAMLARHGATPALTTQAEAEGISRFALLDRLLGDMAARSDGETATLTAARHVQPDIHGNRSPLAEPWRHAGIDGITLDTGVEDLALDYLATLQALAYGTRHILEAMRDTGVVIREIVPSGGLARNRLFLREVADATGCAVVVPQVDEPVLLGVAMLGAVAAGDQPDAAAAMAALAPACDRIEPRTALADWHGRKYRVFRRMQDDHAAYAAIMTDTAKTDTKETSR
ncbi:ribulokinase [Pacificitalea manganoxidans]|uniref:Ribulokinase n=1 Tax=Pacificitalea manganoxidans TaxID=1411902 RepID=A0A291LZ98_9RHOB|nr:FGGY-family carbohydrate kinase [Pacificitalea manganoxidans]ATI42019.1 ribulokinase [Pacificitalea manganoxidans]MDR6309516.1 FGGY-family pentulose kinase [Pacificitalea manganoxidans]